jgi:hypothetical protein
MMKCPTCAREVPADAQFCIYCAARLMPEIETAEPKAATGPTRRLDSEPVYDMPDMTPAPAGQPAATVTRRRHHHKELSTPFFFIGLAVLFATGNFWPGVLLLVGITSFINESARGRHREAVQGLIFFGGLTVLFATGWFWPGILLLLGLMAIMKPHGWRC